MVDINLLVHTTNGVVRGRSSSVQTRIVREFLGIPYAKPPLDTLRFERPHAMTNWKGVRTAHDYGSPCVQFIPGQILTPWISNRTGSEDCLYLNIWTPTKKVDHNALLTVMVWFHGGAFFSGSADLELYKGEQLAASGDVVVVSINYRLVSYITVRLR